MTEQIEQIKQLAYLLSTQLRLNENFISFNGSVLRFKYNTQDNGSIEQLLKQLNFKFEPYPNNEIELVIDECYNENLVFFLHEDDYLKRIKNYLEKFNELNLIILQTESGYLIKQSQSLFSQENAIFFNAIYYKQILDFVTSNTDFVAVLDKAMYNFIIFSGDSGAFHIGYNPLENRIKNLPDLSLYLKDLKEAFDKLDFIQFFKSSIIQGVHKEEIKNRFFTIIQSLQVILELATKDYEIYLRQFAFDKIKTKFKEERNKYFESIEKNIDAVSKQVTSFPLTFAASIFAGYQVKDRPSILILVFLAYCLYTFIAWKILEITALNTDNIKSDIDLEEDKIKNGYLLIYEEFQSDFKKIKEKLDKLSNLIFYLRIILIGLLVVFLIFGIYENYFVQKEKLSPIEVKIVK